MYDALLQLFTLFATTERDNSTQAGASLGMQSGDITADQLLANPATLYSTNPPWHARYNGDSCGRYDDWGLVSTGRYDDWGLVSTGAIRRVGIDKQGTIR